MKCPKCSSPHAYLAESRLCMVRALYTIKCRILPLPSCTANLCPVSNGFGLTGQGATLMRRRMRIALSSRDSKAVVCYANEDDHWHAVSEYVILSLVWTWRWTIIRYPIRKRADEVSGVSLDLFSFSSTHHSREWRKPSF